MVRLILALLLNVGITCVCLLRSASASSQGLDNDFDEVYSNYYALLGVSRSAKLSTIRRAYRAKSRELHPDTASGGASIEFSELVEVSGHFCGEAR